MEDLRWKNKDRDKIGDGRMMEDSEKIKISNEQ
jgi:hypothetical protein